MANVAALPEDELAGFAEMFGIVEERMGFVPNSLKTMARKPEMLAAFVAFFGTVAAPGTVSPELKQLIAHIASAAAGCRYCQAHTGHVAERMGADAAKVAAVWSYETSDLFSPAEKAALALAQAAAEVPNRAGAAEFARARDFFDDEALVEIVAMVAVFGFLNRWNDTMGTDLEDSPLAFAEAHLGGVGWEAGKHKGE